MPVFQLAVEVAVLAYRGTDAAPRRAWPLTRQLLASTSSIALNIAEGAEEYRPLEKARFYRMARRSAGEAAGTVNVLLGIGALRPEDARDCIRLLARTAAMLTGLAKSHEARAIEQGKLCPTCGRKRSGSRRPKSGVPSRVRASPPQPAPQPDAFSV
jgi:four helix bundle protein